MNLKFFYKPFINLAFNKRNHLIKKKIIRYKEATKEDINFYQIKEFNKIWAHASANIPFYKYFKQKYSLPNNIKSLKEIEDFPQTSKKLFQDYKDLIFENKKYQTISTGGSSGHPTKFITSKADADNNYANTYLGRMQFNINPLDKMILIWGHSHLFGSGIRGRFNNIKRNILDSLLNIKRLNAYDLSPDSVMNFIKEIEANNPSVIIGYTSSLFTLSKYISDNNISLQNIDNLLGVIVTSEEILDEDINIIEKALQTNVILEYGTAETGVIAYSKPKYNKEYHVFWDSFIAQEDLEGKLLITTISQRAFPLIRYQTDDIIVGSDNSASILSFATIHGRPKDIFSIFDKNHGLVFITGIVIAHILKAIPGVYFFSFEQKQTGILKIFVVIDEKCLLEEIVRVFNSEILKENPNVSLDGFNFLKISKPIRTLAGKNRVNIS